VMRRNYPWSYLSSNTHILSVSLPFSVLSAVAPSSFCFRPASYWFHRYLLLAPPPPPACALPSATRRRSLLLLLVSPLLATGSTTTSSCLVIAPPVGVAALEAGSS
jgi:hypothetical protein